MMADPTIGPPIDGGNPGQDLLSTNERIVRTPTGRNLLGRLTVVCLVLNRTIGSGIFVVPALVAGGARSASGALTLWAGGAFISTCGLMVWLQLGLSLPLLKTGRDQKERAVPRSGGEKNYLEFIYYSETRNRPKLLVKCMYGIAFVVLGNLSGNAIAFGIYVTSASEHSPDKSFILGIAIAALTGVVMLNMLSSRVAILFNNVFAVIKVALLVVMIVFGFVNGRSRNINFDMAPFKPGPSADVPSISYSLMYIIYTFSGFEQPFYVLTEVRKPRRVFPIYTLLAMATVVILFMLVNAAYFFAVPWNLPALHDQRNMAIVFFGQVFGGDNRAARRAMDSLTAFSIFGNLLVMTYTASRVKQEIAKEGILPWSLWFATSHRTPFERVFGNTVRTHLTWLFPAGSAPEEAPMAALVLHWGMSVLLVLVTLFLDPTIAYSVLVTLYSYVIIVLIGFFTSVGLLYLKWKSSRNWKEPNFDPTWGWLYAAVYALACGFMLIAALWPPADGSPYSFEATKVKWFILPAIGLSAPFWGMLYHYAILRVIMLITRRDLVVDRSPMTEPDREVSGQYIMTAERITYKWRLKKSARARGHTLELGNVGNDGESHAE